MRFKYGQSCGIWTKGYHKLQDIQILEQPGKTLLEKTNKMDVFCLKDDCFEIVLIGNALNSFVRSVSLTFFSALSCFKSMKMITTIVLNETENFTT